MKRVLIVSTVLVTLLSGSSAAYADGPMVHNYHSQDRYTGYYTVPYEHAHYARPSNVHYRGSGVTATKQRKTTIKRHIHFKTKSSKARFDKWYFATHKKH